MHTRSTSLLALSLCSSFAIAGCDEDPPTPTAVRGQISSDLGNVLREASTASTSTDALPTSATLGLIDRVLGTSTQGGISLGTTAARLTERMAGGARATGGIAIDADAQIAYLNDKLFTDANHVGAGVYQIPASLVCARTAVDSTGTSVDSIDPKCAEQLAKIDLRIRTAKDGGTLVFALQVDAAHDEPLRLELTHTSIALTVDLDGLQHATDALALLLGETAPNMALSGELTGKLEILGAAKARASLSIDRALSIQVASAGGDLKGADAFVLASAKAEAFAVTLDGAAKSGSFETNLGDTVLKTPAVNGKRFELDLPGVSATAAFAEGKPLTLSHLGLGNRSTTTSINGVRAQTIDLNPQDGRALDMTVTPDAQAGAVTLAVTPKLDLQMSVDHTVLGDKAPAFDVTRVQLSGSLHSSEASDQIQVATGAFSLTTNPAGHGFSATAGQCVTGTDAVDPGTGTTTTQWTVGTCK
jgi:hypothetical protein